MADQLNLPEINPSKDPSLNPVDTILPDISKQELAPHNQESKEHIESEDVAVEDSTSGVSAIVPPTVDNTLAVEFENLDSTMGVTANTSAISAGDVARTSATEDGLLGINKAK